MALAVKYPITRMFCQSHGIRPFFTSERSQKAKNSQNGYGQQVLDGLYPLSNVEIDHRVEEDKTQRHQGHEYFEFNILTFSLSVCDCPITDLPPQIPTLSPVR